MFEDDNVLIHYGVKYRSGRYPYGSGEDPYQHDPFFSKVQSMKKAGKTEKEIASYFGLSTGEYRKQYSFSFL
ncbi:MAG: hypothetical protein HUJ68_07935, partial [Clostridia bacterium]|nr:hypothetical protein [Clostridia bacterium]